MKTTIIKDKVIIGDASINPPSAVKNKKLNVRLMIQFEDQFIEYFIVQLAIPLDKVRDGTLREVPAIFIVD